MAVATAQGMRLTLRTGEASLWALQNSYRTHEGETMTDDTAKRHDRKAPATISLPISVLDALDSAAEKLGETRSAFLATAATERMERMR